jgi:hypothetical protein
MTSVMVPLLIIKFRLYDNNERYWSQCSVAKSILMLTRVVL